MAILNIAFLLNRGHELLLEEGYVCEDTILEDDNIYDKKFIDPYYLYDEKGVKIDAIYYIEYCNQIIDDEYLDGRMKWETIKAKWQKNIDGKEVCTYTF